MQPRTMSGGRLLKKGNRGEDEMDGSVCGFRRMSVCRNGCKCETHHHSLFCVARVGIQQPSSLLCDVHRWDIVQSAYGDWDIVVSATQVRHHSFYHS